MTKVIWRFFLSWFILDRLGRDRTANKSLFGGGGGGAGGPPGEIPNCRHQTGKICENVKYNLQQYKYRGQKDIFKALYEAALVGPEAVKPAEAEDILGLNTNLVTKAISKRSSMGFPMDFDSEDSIPGSVFSVKIMKSIFTKISWNFIFPIWILMAKILHSYSIPEFRGGPGGGRRGVGGGQYKLRDLFVLYAKLGDRNSTGQHINLAQCDKWLKQAGVIDNWNVTSTDTASCFRKISR